MLSITIPAAELFNEETEEFLHTEALTIELEHSLIALAEWEAKWKTPFYGRKPKTAEQVLDYIRCMSLTKNVDPSAYANLTDENLESIRAYIDDSMTASWFTSTAQKSSSSEQVTSELIYYWMIALDIPFECQYWHINRLFTLIRICSIKNQPSKKMSRASILKQNAVLNAARRKKY